MTATERKHHSEQKLKSLGIVLSSDLPPLESEAELTLKSPQQIARRILIFAYLNCVAFDPSLQQEVMVFLIREKLWDEASSVEKALFHKPQLSEDETAEIQWRSESIWLMLWAINEVDILELRTKEINPEEIFALLPGFFENTEQFIQTADTRNSADILDEGDFTFRLSWAIREAEERGETIPGINAFVAYQRYVSLNWIMNITEHFE